jgi:hypothetical protein
LTTSSYTISKRKLLIKVRKGRCNAEKMSKLIEEIQKYKRLKFDSESSIDKKNSI